MAGKKTDLERMLDAIKAMKKPLGTTGQLAEKVVDSCRFAPDKALRLVTKAITDPVIPLISAGGGKILYTGSDVAIYPKVAVGLLGKFGEKQKWRNELVVNVSAQKASGTWRNPDLVMLADPARKDSVDDPRRLHCLEVEFSGGFDIPSAYQAYEQGRGADYRWLLGVPDPDANRNGSDQIERIATICKELGVGLVLASHLNRPAQWTLEVAPKRLNPSPVERACFLKRLGIATELTNDRSRIGYMRSAKSAVEQL